MHHAEIRVVAATPGVAIGVLLYDGGFLSGKGVVVAADQHLVSEVGARVEWRVDVDEIDFARELFEQRTHDEKVVAPDEFVTPSGLKSVAFLPLPHVEQGCLQTRVLRLARCAALIDRLDDLKRKVQAGDEGAYDQVFRRWYPALVRVASGLLHDPDAADEVAQEVMLELWRRRQYRTIPATGRRR